MCNYISIWVNKMKCKCGHDKFIYNYVRHGIYSDKRSVLITCKMCYKKYTDDKTKWT